MRNRKSKKIQRYSFHLFYFEFCSPSESEGLIFDLCKQDDSLSQLLDNGSVSFGRYAVESLAWEKRSAFTHDRRHEELEKLKAPGLVARKKAYFEEYYKRLRTIKSLQVIDKIEPPLDIVQVVDDVLRTNDSDGGIEIERPVDGVEAEVSAHLSNLTVQERQTENLMDENATVSLQQWIIRGQATSVPHKDTAAHELQKSSEVSGEEKEVEANHDTQSSVLLIDGSDSHIIAQLPSIDEDLSVREKRENPSSSLIMVFVISCSSFSFHYFYDPAFLFRGDENNEISTLKDSDSTLDLILKNGLRIESHLNTSGNDLDLVSNPSTEQF